MSRVTAASAALFLPTVLFVSAANNILFRNAEEIPYDARRAACFGLAWLLAGPPLVVLFRCARGRAGAATAARLVLLAGASVLVWDGLAWGFRDGVQRFVLVVALDEVVFLLLALVLLRGPFAAIAQTFAVAAWALLGHGVYAHATLARRFAEGRQASAAARAAAPVSARAGPPPARGNIYHIVVDKFQEDAYHVLRAAHPEFAFQGFTLFPAFTCNYFQTKSSLANMLLGRMRRPDESLAGWRRAAVRAGVWQALAAAGWDVTLYPMTGEFCAPGLKCEPAKELYRIEQQPWNDAERAAFYTARQDRLTVDLWFLSLLPRSARDLLNYGVADVARAAQLREAAGLRKPFSITDRLLGPLVPPPRKGVRADVSDVPVLEYGQPYTARAFRQMLAAEAERPAHGQYVFVHLLVPHEPFVVNEACEYTGQVYGPWSAEGYLEQATCALRLVRALVGRLHTLGRLDDALIVVTADHGWYEGLRPALEALDAAALPPDPVAAAARAAEAGGPPARPRSVQMAAARSNGLLLIKFPHATERGASPFPAQMIDLAPTILRHAGLAADGYPGVPLQVGTLVDRASEFRRVDYWNHRSYAFRLVNGEWTFRGESAVRP